MIWVCLVYRSEWFCVLSQQMLHFCRQERSLRSCMNMMSIAKLKTSMAHMIFKTYMYRNQQHLFRILKVYFVHIYYGIIITQEMFTKTVSHVV